MISTLIAVAVIGTLVALLAFFLFKGKAHQGIIARLVRVEKEVAELREKGGIG